ncbi:MAG: YfhO family protein, partial [Pirellulales bacterium]|nr:YfhO family protein [Pirellulales bacterium]
MSASLLRPVRTIAWLSIAGLFVWVFSGALLRGGIWVFRDSGHYYYPLLRFAGQQLAAGAPALWNPLDNLGVPLAGNPTASLFYPPAWIFALPSGDGWTYRLYVLGHAVLALATSYRLARRWNASPAAATVAALSYVFCGNVLYQVCNVIFLVGAAWMPLALLAAERMLRRRSLAASLALAAVLAAMTLGGDPQSAYHVGLLAGLYAILLWWRKRRGGRSDAMRGAAQQAPSGGGWPRPALLAVSATGAFLLAAVQVLPSSELTGQSSRYHTEVARNLYELVSVEGSAGLGPGRSWSDGLLCRNLDRAMHHNHVYHFSVGPWRMVEYLWPNVMGRQFPTHRRWAA